MSARWPSATGLILLIVVVVGACAPQETVRLSASPTIAAARTTSAPTASPRTTPSASPTPAAASPSGGPRPTTGPGSTPPAACPALAGGGPTTPSATLHDLRVAHHPGYDRLVFEFDGPAMPQYRVELAGSFQAPSGLPVHVDGNAFIRVGFQGAAAHFDTGGPSYTGPNPIDPGLPMIREVRMIEDFEAVLVWGVGLERLSCPTASVLAGPVRLVLDFPTPQ